MQYVTDAFGIRKKHDAMLSTWGHLYPEGSSKHPGVLVVAKGEYGDRIIVSSDFPTLESSPMRYGLEHTIFDYFEFEYGKVYRICCVMWFFKNVQDMYKSDERIGKFIKLNVVEILI